MDHIPRQGADEVVPGVGVAGPQTRLVREHGVPVARLVPAAGCHAGREDRQVHAVRAVQALVQEPPIHRQRPLEGENARLPQASRPPIWLPRVGECCRRVAELGSPCVSGTLLLRAVPHAVAFVLVSRAAMGAHGACSRAMV